MLMRTLTALRLLSNPQIPMQNSNEETISDPTYELGADPNYYTLWDKVEFTFEEVKAPPAADIIVVPVPHTFGL